MNDNSANVRENLHFLVCDVENQLDELKRYFKPDRNSSSRRILERQGYCENLALSIQNACVQGIAESRERKFSRLRAIQSVAADLDRICELIRDAVTQFEQIERNRVVREKKFLMMLSNVRQGVGFIEPILRENDSRRALKLGEIEVQIKFQYKELLQEYTHGLKQKQHTEDLILAILIAHTFERMGDRLLDIGDALLSSIIGQPIDLERYRFMIASVKNSGEFTKRKALVVEPIAETRSGGGVSAIAQIAKPKKNSRPYSAIYKDGLQRKVKEERDRVANWHEIYPGLAPRILSYKKRGHSASLLIEHLSGMTFEQILVKEKDTLLEQCLQKLEKTLNLIWKETQREISVPAAFMQQLKQRVNEVYAVHPEFESRSSELCGHAVQSFDDLIEQAEKIEQHTKPPFSVYIHGDFNVDNIIYDPREKKISYIDLHRSCYMDYVQDVSVFMVSNYRLQIMAPPVRQRITNVIGRIYKIARRHARRNNDESFELRLALGLTRSLVTSTRFILDKSLARNMYLRARYLLEQIDALPSGDYNNYKVPVRELFIG